MENTGVTVKRKCFSARGDEPIKERGRQSLQSNLTEAKKGPIRSAVDCSLVSMEKDTENSPSRKVAS